MNIFFLFDAVQTTGRRRDFGGVDHGDDQASLLNSGNKPLTQIVQDDSFREFEFRQYLFACQSKVCQTKSYNLKLVVLKNKKFQDSDYHLKFILDNSWILLLKSYEYSCSDNSDL